MLIVNDVTAVDGHVTGDEDADVHDDDVGNDDDIDGDNRDLSNCLKVRIRVRL